jgi:hypothetical protein
MKSKSSHMTMADDVLDDKDNLDDNPDDKLDDPHR